MKKKFKTVFTVFFLVLIKANFFAQTITFDYEKKEFDNIFPFDKPFKILVINLPSVTKKVSIEIKNITNVGKIRKKLQKEKREVTKAAIFNHELAERSIFMHSRELDDGGTDKKNIALIEIVPLAPNQSYYVEVSVWKKGQLTNTQKRNVEAFIIQKGVIEDFAKNVLQEIMSPQRGDTSGFDRSYIIEKYDAFLSSLNDVIKRYDPAYEFKKSQTTFANDLQNVRKLSDIDIAYRDFKESVLALNEELIKNNLPPIDLNKKLPNNLWIAADKDTGDLITEKYNSNLEEYKKEANDKYKDLLNEIKGSKSTLITGLCDLIKKDAINNSLSFYESLNATYETDLVKNANTLVTADIGYGFAPGINRHFGFTAMHIYFRPINKTIPLNHYSGWDYLTSRTSVMFGLSLVGKIDKPFEREGLIDGKGLLAGAGFKILPWLKLSGGALVYHEIVSPLISEKNIRSTWFLSASIDFSLKPVFVDALKNK